MKVIGKGAFGEVSLVSMRRVVADALITYLSIGPSCTESRYWENLCNEDIEEGGDVEEGPGEFRWWFCVCLGEC